MNSTFRTLLLSFAMCLVVGCGQKGPLYFPEDEDEEEQTSSSQQVDPVVSAADTRPYPGRLRIS